MRWNPSQYAATEEKVDYITFHWKRSQHCLHMISKLVLVGLLCIQYKYSSNQIVDVLTKFQILRSKSAMTMRNFPIFRKWKSALKSFVFVEFLLMSLSSLPLCVKTPSSETHQIPVDEERLTTGLQWITCWYHCGLQSVPFDSKGNNNWLKSTAAGYEFIFVPCGWPKDEEN